MHSSIASALYRSADGSLRPDGHDYFADNCYACPGCGRVPLVSDSTSARHEFVLSCGHSGCELPLVFATGMTAADATENWNRKALDIGDMLEQQGARVSTATTQTFARVS